jgi:uncharacterized membrane protein
MDFETILIILLIGTVLVLGPLVAFILSIVAFVRTRRIAELSLRIAQLEARLRGELPARAPATAPTESDIIAAEVVTETAEVGAAPSTSATAPVPPVIARPPAAVPASESAAWETFIGQKAFGWLAVVLFVFAAGFFLRYAYQNNWIGPVGRVALGELAGVALIVFGYRYFRQGWQRFSAMLTSAGVVVLYLATYSAFGFYQLLPQRHAGVFLAVLVIESMIAAVIYRSAAIALVAVLGGLLTPLLMYSERDIYTELFIYLAVLNAGVVVALLLRSWPAVGSAAYLGTQILFWFWYDANYHPEKFAWTLGFQLVIFALYLVQGVCTARFERGSATWEDLARFTLNAILGFAAFYVLTRADYRVWLGSAAMLMAAVYAIVGRVVLAWRPRDNRLVLTSLAISVGFVARAVPIQADAHWVSLGWAAMGASLWWFGQRISTPLLRIMAGVLITLALARFVTVDIPIYTRDPFIPIFNGFALPSLGVAFCILAAVMATDRFLPQLHRVERLAVGAAGIAGVVVVWLVLSVDCYGYFDSQAIGTNEVQIWRWRGQLALTVLWTVFASALLVLGFQLDRVRLRWLAIALYGLTVMKVFLVDMANVQQLYRILAFFVLSVVLALVARAYQRLK